MADPEPFDPFAAAMALPRLPPPPAIQGAEATEFTLGDVRVRCVSDGAMTLPFGALCPGADPGALATALGLSQPQRYVRGDMTSILIETGDDLVLIEAGAGGDWQSGTGRLARHLAANHVPPEAVTCLVLTHLHPDHAWGALTADGAPLFPNARVVIGEAEAQFWAIPGLANKVNPAFRPTVLGAQRVLQGLGDRIQTVKEGEAAAPSLVAIDTPGHSPGHISLLLEAGDGLVIGGDAAVNDTLSLAYPDWPFGFDTDPELAAQSRRKVLGLAADNHHAMAGVHWTWPGIGHVQRRKDAFELVPWRGREGAVKASP